MLHNLELPGFQGNIVKENRSNDDPCDLEKPKNKPVTADRRGMFMLVITGEDAGLRNRILQTFKKV